MATVQQRMQNFRAGQAAYNQFARNVAKLPHLIKERKNLLEAAQRNYAEVTARHWRTLTPGPLTPYQERKIFNTYAKINRNHQRFQAVNAEIIQAKRRLLGMVGRRYRQEMGTFGRNNASLRAWDPTGMLAALRLPFRNKIERALLRHVTRPRFQVPKMVRNNKGRLVSNK